MTERDYYFYLSFENSICVDYVTEKFFNVMTKNIVPVVLGGTDYQNSVGAPPHSLINAYKDYKNPADLARYLQSLIDDPEKYAEYFWCQAYKTFFFVIYALDIISWSVCPWQA
jgi:alpha-1,3-fucosyltransferase